MNLSNAERAEVLIRALPYIQSYNNKIVVVKYGGNAMINEELKNAVMGDLVLLSLIGVKVVLVHGGGPEITEMMDKMGKKSEFKNGLRVTDKDTVGIAQMVLVGKTNKDIVSRLNHAGGKAIGLCGLDGNLIKCKKLFTEVDGEKKDIGFVGDIVKVNTKVIDLLTEDEYIPVIAPIGVDDEGNSYNINADSVASAVAEALNAEKLMYLTDVRGVLDKNEELIHHICTDEVESLIANETITGGMIPKVKGCKAAVENGVERVHIIDGRIVHSILLEIFTDNGIGTMISER